MLSRPLLMSLSSLAAPLRRFLSSSTVQIRGIPPRSLLDEPLAVRLTGLGTSRAEDEVTLHLRAANGINLDYSSVNTYRVGQEGGDGVLDLESRPGQREGKCYVVRILRSDRQHKFH